MRFANIEHGNTLGQIFEFVNDAEKQHFLEHTVPEVYGSMPFDLRPVRTVITNSNEYCYYTNDPEYQITPTEVLEVYTARVRTDLDDRLNKWIDQWAENERKKVATLTPGQVFEYTAKLDEARRVKQAELAGELLVDDDYPFLVQSIVNVQLVSLSEAADIVLAAHAAWSQAGANIASIRAQIKHLLSSATTAEQKITVYETHNLDVMLQQLTNG